MKTSRFVVYAAIIAALYAVMTLGLAPLSYGPLQFRVAECLKGITVWMGWPAVAGFTIGNFLSNLTSPYVGPWELIFMPAANLIGSLLCWHLGKLSSWLGAIAYALVIGTAVPFMLSRVVGAPFWALWPMILVPEFILIIGGLPVMRRISETLWPQ